jgi:hypothetical protein
MEQSPPSMLSKSRYSPHFMDPKIHYRIHKCPPVLSWASSIQSISPHPTSWRSILILSSHLHLVVSFHNVCTLLENVSDFMSLVDIRCSLSLRLIKQNVFNILVGIEVTTYLPQTYDYNLRYQNTSQCQMRVFQLCRMHYPISHQTFYIFARQNCNEEWIKCVSKIR